MISEGTAAPPEPPEGVVVASPPEGAVVASAGVGEAIEASVEGMAGTPSMTPSAGAPSLGGELLIDRRGPGSDRSARTAPPVTPETVRSGILQAGPLAMAGLAANGANAVVTVLVARLLDNRAYGSLAQLTGLFLVVSMPGSAVTVAVVRRITSWNGTEAPGAVRRWAVRLHARGTAAVAVFAVAMVVLRGQIDGFLSSPNSTGVAAMLVAGAVWVLLSFDRGLLQAHRDYRTLATNLLVEGGGRVVGTLCLVGAGFGVAGAAVGVLLAEIVTAVHARIAADGAWAVPRRTPADGRAGRGWATTASGAVRRWWSEAWGAVPRTPVVSGERWSIAVDLLIAFPSLALIALLQNVDVIVVARDAPHASGSYAAISVISKAVVFAAVALGGYLLPEAAIRWHQGHHALRQLAVTLVLLGLPAIALLAVAVAAPHLLVTVVFSPRYAAVSHSLATLVLAMIFLSVTVTLTMYLLAVGCRWIVGVLLVGSVAATVAVALAHGVPAATASHDLVVQAALAAAICVGFAAVHVHRLRPLRVDAAPG